MKRWIWLVPMLLMACSQSFYSNLFHKEANEHLAKDISDAQTKLRELEAIAAGYSRFQSEVKQICGKKREVRMIPAPREESVVKDDNPMPLPGYYREISASFQHPDLVASYEETMRKIKNLEPIVVLVEELKRAKEICWNLH